MGRAGGTCGGADNAYKVWWWFLKETGDAKDLDIDGNLIFAYIVVYNLLKRVKKTSLFIHVTYA